MSQTQPTTTAPVSFDRAPRLLVGVEVSAALIARRYAETLTPQIARAIAKREATTRGAGAMTLARPITDAEETEARAIANRACLLLLLDNMNSAAGHVTRHTGITRGASRKLVAKARAAMAADADLLDITEPLRMPAARNWETISAIAYDESAETRALTMDSNEYVAALMRRNRERRTGVDDYTNGTREEAIARMAEDLSPLRSLDAWQLAAYTKDTHEALTAAALLYTRGHYDPRGMSPQHGIDDPIQRFTNRAIFLAARKRFATLLATFTPQPVGLTKTGKPIMPNADQREDQYQDHIEAITAPALTFAESLRDALDWRTLFGPTEPRRTRRPRPAPTDEQRGSLVTAEDLAEARARRNKPTAPAFGETEREEQDAQDRAEALRRARLSARDTFSA